MSKKTRKWRSAIAMVLVITMLFSIFPTAVFAASGDTPEEIKYVSFGDSMSNGYGLEGYELNSGVETYGKVAYANKFADWLVEAGYASSVDHAQLSMSGIRAEDLHWLLELDYNDQEAIDLIQELIDGKWDEDKWNAKFTTGDYWTLEEICDHSRLDATYLAIVGGQNYDYPSDPTKYFPGKLDSGFVYPTTYDSNAELEYGKNRAMKVALVAKYFQEHAAEADIVSLAVANGNLGVFGFGRLLDIIGFDGDGVVGTGVYKVDSAIRELDPEMQAAVLALKAELYAAVEDKLGMPIGQNATLKDLADVVVYIGLSMALNYAGSIEAVLQLNPDAEIMMVALMNTFAEEGEVEGISIGDLMNVVVTPMNAYLAALPTVMQAVNNGVYKDAKFYYAEAPFVECMVATYEEGKLDSIARDRFVKSIVGEKSTELGMVWNLLIGTGMVEFITVDEVNYYDGLSDVDKLAYAAYTVDDVQVNAKKATSISIYLAFENAVIKCKDEPVTVESVMGLGDMTGNLGFNSILAEYTARAGASVATADQLNNLAEFIASQSSGMLTKDQALALITAEENLDDIVDETLAGVASVMASGMLGYNISLDVDQVNALISDNEETSNDALYALVADLSGGKLTPAQVETLYGNPNAVFTFVSEKIKETPGIPLAFLAYINADLIKEIYDGTETSFEEYIPRATVQENVNNLKDAISKIDLIKGKIPEIKAGKATMKAVPELADTLAMLLVTPDVLATVVYESELAGLLALFGRCVIGNGLGAHPSAKGHNALAEAVIAAYANGHTAQDETIENLKAALEVAEDIVVEYYDDAYAYAYAYAADNGYIDTAIAGINGVIGELETLKAELDAINVTDEFRAEVKAEIDEIIGTLNAAIDLIEEADVLDQATVDALMALLHEADDTMVQLVNVLEQFGTDVNNLAIIPTLKDARAALYDLTDDIDKQLQKAVAEGTAWLLETASEQIAVLKDVLNKLAVETGDAVYQFLYDHPEEVINFVKAYGNEIRIVVEYYGVTVLGAVAYIAYYYGEEIVAFAMENKAEIIEITAMLLDKYGEGAAALIQVYAEALGLCDAVRDTIADIEKQIADLNATLEKELKVQLAMLNAQLDALYAQLETATGATKAEIEAAIAEVEALIAKVEKAIEDIEAAIAVLEAQLAEAKAELAKAMANLDELMAAIKDAIEVGAENIEEIIANVADAIEAVKEIIDRVEDMVKAINDKLAANDIIGAIEAALESLTNDWNALVEQFEVLKNAVNNIDELTAGLLSAINAYLADATEASLKALQNALYELAVATGDEVYWFLYNNPDKVVGFFAEYGDEIAVLMEEYGPYALGAMGYLAMEYGDEIVAFALENKAEIIEVTAMLLEKHGENAAKLINVYAEYFGWCDEVREVIADIEGQIDALKAELAELYAEYVELKAQLEDLYAQLENASEAVKAEIEAAIAEVEALIAEVEKAIAEIEAAIEALEAQLAAAKAELEKSIAAIEAVVEAIKEAIEAGVETVEEILAVIEAVVEFAEETIAGVKTAMEGIVNAVEEIVAFVEKLIENGIIAVETMKEIIDYAMDIIDGVKAELDQGDIEGAIEEIRLQLTNGYEELHAMLAAIDFAIAAELDAIVGDLEDALAQAQDEFIEALYNATNGEFACDAETIAVYGGETVATVDGYASIVADEWGLELTKAVDVADVILYQVDPQIFVTALLESLNGAEAPNWSAYINDETALEYFEQAKAELVKELVAEYGETAAAMLEPMVDHLLYAVVEYAVTNVQVLEGIRVQNPEALIVAVGMYNPLQDMTVTVGGEVIDIEALCQYLIEVTDVYNLLYAVVSQNVVFVEVCEAEAVTVGDVNVDRIMGNIAELMAKIEQLTAQLEEELTLDEMLAIADEIELAVEQLLEEYAILEAMIATLDSNYATEAGHAYIAEQILNAVEKADHACVWAIGDNEHCYYCENCGEEFVCGPHEFDSDEDADCDICGYERIIIDPTPEITTSSIVVYYLNENNVAIKETTVKEITTTGSYRFNIPDPITFNGVDYLFNNLQDKDASDDYDATLDEDKFFVHVDVMPTTSSALEFVLNYIETSSGTGGICLSSITLDPEEVSLKVGKSKVLTLTISPERADIASVVWTSSDETVATVDQNGKVTAVHKGNATITVTVTDYDGCIGAATCEVTVTKASSGGFGGGGSYVKPVEKEEKPKLPGLKKDVKLTFMGGYADKLFRPDAEMTRGEVAAVFARLMDVEKEAGKVYIGGFTDVPMSLWCANDIGFIAQYGLLAGYGDGTFRPEQPITRAELIAIASRFEVLAEGKAVFNDVSDRHWAEDCIHDAAAAGWVNGYADGSFKPDNHVTRAEVAAILCNVLDYNATAGYVAANYDLTNTFADVTPDHWAYWSIMAAANAHK